MHLIHVSILLACLVATEVFAVECYYCGNKKDCENPRKTVCERGSCAKIERGESMQKGCYTMGNEFKYNHEDKCFVDLYQRNVCTCNDQFCNSAQGIQSFTALASAFVSFIIVRIF